MKYKFGDLVKDVKININQSNNPYDVYVAGEHMDTDDFTIHRYGKFSTDDVGPAFIRYFKPGQVLYGSRRTYLRKVAVADFEGITSNTTFVLETKNEGIKIDESVERIYPNNSLASHVLGFVGTDNQGLYGIEKTYEDILTGIPGRVISETDGRGNDIPFSSEEYYAPQNGRDLVLTIDASSQYFAEKY